ncbi:MAG: hypothetical protein JRI91_05750 [Deltaproteobacteria bacterium]|nr:hypothetical protein [Deltaproteobacteria bacterium]
MYGLQDVWSFVSNYIFKKKRVLSKALIAGIVSLMLFINAEYIINLFNSVEPFSYINGSIGRDAYIEKRRPEYAALKYANKHLGENSKIFGIFIGQRGYYSEKEVFFDFHLLDDSVKSSESSDNISIDLRSKEITHLLIKYDIFNNWAKHHFNEKEKSILNEFMEKKLKMIFSRNGYRLYQCI